jgi:regulator of protease activity HflC (stomatin/prohibitin superfamily)
MHMLTPDFGVRLAATNGATSTTVFWTMAGVVCLILLVGASTRFVARNERAVISRADHVTRVAGSGLAVRIPVLEKVRVVSMDPVDLPLVLDATTHDGVRVRILATAVCRITEPEGSTIVDEPHAETARAVERQIQQEVGVTRLDQLVLSGAKLTYLPALLSRETVAWGAEVTSVRVDAVEVELTPSSLQAIRATGHQPPRQGNQGETVHARRGT